MPVSKNAFDESSTGDAPATPESANGFSQMKHYTAVCFFKAAQLRIMRYAFISGIFFAFSFVIPLNGESRTVRVGVFPAAPLVMINDNKPEGLFIDLIEYFSQALGWQIQYVPGSWSELLVSLEKNEIDLLPAVGYTRERAGIYDFSSNPVYIDSGVLFTSPKFTLHTVFDLQGKRVAALKGSIFTDGFMRYISSFGVKCNIILTKDNRAVMQAIENGDADAGVCIYSLGNELVKEYKVTLTPISFSPIALEFAVPKGKNSDLIADINRIMSSMISDPESLYSRSFRKWTVPRPNGELPAWITWGFFGLVASGFFLGLWNFILKRQVVSKTKHLEIEIFEHMQAEEKIRQSLEEKETLIRELYHRTKNTMQVIRGMVVLQAEDYPENKDIQQLVKNTEDRIQAISLVHQMLYKSKDLSHISIKEYVEELSTLILQSSGIFDGRISTDIRIDDQFFLLDTAIPLGLILNELMTNSINHAFPDNRKGGISISLTQAGPEKSILVYSDNGIGVPEGFNFRDSNTLGLKLVHNIGELQLMGKVNFKNENGVSCTIEILTSLYRARV